MRGLWSGWINIQNQYEDINNISTTNISFDHFDYLIISIILVFDLEFGSKLKSVFQKHRQFPWYERGLEAVVKTCSVKKVFIEILQNSQENTCASLFLIKLQAPGEICEIFKYTFFTEQVWATATELIPTGIRIDLRLHNKFNE